MHYQHCRSTGKEGHFHIGPSPTLLNAQITHTFCNFFTRLTCFCWFQKSCSITFSKPVPICLYGILALQNYLGYITIELVLLIEVSFLWEKFILYNSRGNYLGPKGFGRTNFGKLLMWINWLILSGDQWYFPRVGNLWSAGYWAAHLLISRDPLQLKNSIIFRTTL